MLDAKAKLVMPGIHDVMLNTKFPLASLRAAKRGAGQATRRRLEIVGLERDRRQR